MSLFPKRHFSGIGTERKSGLREDCSYLLCDLREVYWAQLWEVKGKQHFNGSPLNIRMQGQKKMTSTTGISLFYVDKKSMVHYSVLSGCPRPNYPEIKNPSAVMVILRHNALSFSCSYRINSEDVSG